MSDRNNRQQQTRMTYVVGFLALFAMPAFVTAIAPVSWVVLTRDNGQVTARVRTCAFLVVPYLTRELAPVASADGSYNPGRYERDGRGREMVTEAEAFLVLHGPDGELSVPVSPVNVDHAIRSAELFIKKSHASSRTLVLVANWKFSVILGIPLTLLALVWLIGALAAVWRSVSGAPPGRPAEE